MNATRPPLWKKALRILLWVGGGLLVLLVLGLFLFDRVLRSKYEPALAQLRNDVTHNVDFFCEQQEVLARDAWFHEPRTEGDAGPLLNAWVAWDPNRQMPKDSPLAIPASLPQRGADFKDWLTSQADVSTLDFGWMQRLRAYDRWDILRDSPVPPPERIDWATASIPNFVSLQMWGKFRLLQGLRTGQPLEAAKDVRHLAWLMYRTDTLIGAVVATTLLSSERDAHDAMKDPPAEWRPMSREQIARMRALLMSGHVFANLAAPVEVARKARRCGEPVVTRCTALAEASFMARYLQPLAADSYPEAYAALREDAAAPPCPTSIASTVWERGITIEDSGTGLQAAAQPQWMQRLPRAYFGSRIASIVIAVGSPSLKPLREFREKLATGDFEKKP